MRLDKLTIAFDDKPAIVSNISFDFEEPGIYALMGASGLGKTSLLKTVAGLLTPAQGQVLGLHGRRVTMLFQEDRLLPWRTVLQNVMLTMPTPDEDKATTLLRSMGITDVHMYPAACSGGMQRRVALARALAHGGEVLLLDEPFTGMDEELKESVAQVILNNCGKLLIFTTHERQDVQMMGAVPLMLHQNRIETLDETGIRPSKASGLRV